MAVPRITSATTIIIFFLAPISRLSPEKVEVTSYNKKVKSLRYKNDNNNIEKL